MLIRASSIPSFRNSFIPLFSFFLMAVPSPSVRLHVGHFVESDLLLDRDEFSAEHVLASLDGKIDLNEFRQRVSRGNLTVASWAPFVSQASGDANVIRNLEKMSELFQEAHSSYFSRLSDSHEGYSLVKAAVKKKARSLLANFKDKFRADALRKVVQNVSDSKFYRDEDLHGVFFELGIIPDDLRNHKDTIAKIQSVKGRFGNQAFWRVLRKRLAAANTSVLPKHYQILYSNLAEKAGIRIIRK